jgi:hypothetical protein
MRQHDRKPVVLPFQVRTAGSQLEGGLHLDSIDLSEGGAFLQAELLFEVGERLTVEIPLPSGDVLKTTARVARVARKADPAAPPGMGIEFTGLSFEDRRLIQEGTPWLRPSRS